MPYLKVVTMLGMVLKTPGWGTKQCSQLSLAACQQIPVKEHWKNDGIVGGVCVHILDFYMKPDHCTDKRGPSVHCLMPQIPWVSMETKSTCEEEG